MKSAKIFLKLLYLSVLLLVSVTIGQAIFTAPDQMQNGYKQQHLTQQDKQQANKDINKLVSHANKRKEDVIAKLEQDGLSKAQIEQFLPIAMSFDCPLEHMSCGGYICPVPGPFCLCETGEGFEFR